jgi:hypothetical protein
MYAQKEDKEPWAEALSPLPHANNNKANSGHIKKLTRVNPAATSRTMRDDG